MESAPPSNPSINHPAARIAVVDDDPLSCAMEAHLVSLLGHRALVETTPQRAIERSLGGEFDLILLDLEMPELDGFETLRRLRHAEALQNQAPVPVIAVTGYTSEQDRLRCLIDGFADHVSKPVQAERLEQALQRVLRVGQVAPDWAPAEPRSDAERLRDTALRLSGTRPGQGPYGPTLMESFALRSQQLLEALRAALEARDAPEAVRNARALRSLADFLGVRRLAVMCIQIEECAVPENWLEAQQALLQVERENQAILALLFESAR